MVKTKPQIVVTRKLPDVVETRMRELFDAKLNTDDRPMTQAELVEAARTADVLVPTVTDKIDAGVLAQAGPKLKMIAQFGQAWTISTLMLPTIARSSSPTRPVF